MYSHVLLNACIPQEHMQHFPFEHRNSAFICIFHLNIKTLLSLVLRDLAVNKFLGLNANQDCNQSWEGFEDGNDVEWNFILNTVWKFSIGFWNMAFHVLKCYLCDSHLFAHKSSIFLHHEISNSFLSSIFVTCKALAQNELLMHF